MSALAFTIAKPVSAAQPAASMSNVVRLRPRGQRLPKRELVTGADGAREPKIARTPLPAAAANSSRWSGRIVAINDFAHTGRGGQAIEKHEASTIENEVRLTLAELLVTALLFMSAATPAALVWLLLRTAS